MTKPLKIVHVNDIAYVGLNFVEALNILGHESQMICLRLPGALLPDYQKALYIPARIKELISINHQIIAGHYDVVHHHYGYLGMLGILGRYPYYLHLHGGDIRGVHKDPLRWMPTRESIKRAEKCFFVTPDLAEDLNAVRSGGIFTPNPICTERLKPAEEARKPSNPPRVLIISALSSNKGVSTAFKAVEILKEAGYRFGVSAIAIGPEKEKYLGIPDVKFYPEVPYIDTPGMNIVHDHRMAQLINDHDIVLGQLVIGSLGLAELEAMSCEKPVISYVTNGDWYPEPPPLLSAKGPEEVASCLARLLDHPEEGVELGKNARHWVVDYHDYLKVTRQVLEIYIGNKSTIYPLNSNLLKGYN